VHSRNKRFCEDISRIGGGVNIVEVNCFVNDTLSDKVIENVDMSGAVGEDGIACKQDGGRVVCI
jgi:hypothetical protein